MNSLLKGEQMAADAYEKFIGKAENDEIRAQLENICQGHKSHAQTIANRIRMLGGEPVFNTGIPGAFSRARLSLELNVNKMRPMDILKRAYDGEDRGIAMAEGILRQDMDEDSRNMVNNILSEDHDNLKSMLSMMSDHGYEQ